jgi:hypothetical protein
MRPLAAVLIALLLPAAAFARPGELDRTFGDDGVIVGSSGPPADLIRLLPGQRAAVRWGESWNDAPLRAFDDRGRFEPSFSTAGTSAATTVPGGIVVLRELPGPRWVTQRVGLDGSVDPRYGRGGVAELPFLDRFTPDRMRHDRLGRVFVTGAALGPGDAGTLTVARISPDGTPDSRFGTGGLVRGQLYAYPSAVALGPGGGIWVGVNDHDAAVLELRADGHFGWRAGSDSRRPFPFRDRAMTVPDMLADRRGRLIVAVNGARRGFVFRLRPDGRPDPTFRRLRLKHSLTALARDRDGRLLVAIGAVPPWGETNDVILRRYSRAGQLDRSFGRQGRAVIHAPSGRWSGVAVSSLLIDRRDRILVGGTAYDTHYEPRDLFGRPHPLLARLHG